MSGIVSILHCCGLVTGFGLFLAAVFPSLLHAEVVEGVLRAEMTITADGAVTKSYLLERPAPGYTALEIAPQLQAQCDRWVGARVRVTGARDAQGRFSAESIVALAARAASGASAAADRARTIAMLRIEFPGKLVKRQRGGLYGIVFQDWWGVSNLFLRSSNGKFRFDHQGFANDPLAHLPAIMIEPRAGETCNSNYRDWSNRALRIAAQKGFDPARYDHVVFLFPEHDTIGCSVLGRGELFGKYSWIFRSTVMAIVHEIGHNLGLHHAGVAESARAHAQYADDSSPMGAHPRRPLAFNAINRIQAGWLDAASGHLAEMSGLGAKSFVVQALDVTSSAPNPEAVRAVRIHPPSGGAPFVVSLLSPYSGASARFEDGVSVHRDYGIGRMTRLLTVLEVGASLVDLKEGVTISFIGKTGSGVRVAVRLFSNDRPQTSPRALAQSLVDEEPEAEPCIIVDPCTTAGSASAFPELQACAGREIDPDQASFISGLVNYNCTLSGIDLSQDSNGNGVADRDDYSLDSDGDGASNSYDCAPLDSKRWHNRLSRDTDGDGFADTCCNSAWLFSGNGIPCVGSEAPDGYVPADTAQDNCPYLANSDQADSDRDGIGDACDPDSSRNELPELARGVLSQTQRTVRQALSTSPRRTQLVYLRRAQKLLTLVPPAVARGRHGAIPRRSRLRALRAEIAEVAHGRRRLDAEFVRTFNLKLSSLARALKRSE